MAEQLPTHTFLGPEFGPEWDAMTVQVPFLKAWPSEQVREHLANALRVQADLIEKGKLPLPSEVPA